MLSHTFPLLCNCLLSLCNQANVFSLSRQASVPGRILDPVYYNSSRPPPPGFPIFINETSGTVTVQAGVPQRILLDSLAQYTCAPGC